MFLPNTTIRLMWPGLHVNKVGCYLHVTNNPTSKTENITKKNSQSSADKLNYATEGAVSITAHTVRVENKHTKKSFPDDANPNVSCRSQQCFKKFSKPV